MQLFKKTAALILAAAISFASVSAVAYADDSGVTALESVQLTLDAAKKPAKTTLKVTATRSGYKFSWKKVSGIKAYEIYASKDGGKTYERIASVSSGKTSKTITDLDISKAYLFRIRSYNTSGKKKVYSKFSDIVSIRPVTEAATVDLGKPSEKNTSPKMSSKQLNLVNVPVSKINSNLAYVCYYLGQDLYVIKEKNSDKKQVYKVTKSALRSYKTTGKLKADRIKLDKSLDGIEWYVFSSQIEKCNNAIIYYIDSLGNNNFLTVSYNESSKSLDTIYTTNNYVLTLSKEGYTFECHWEDKKDSLREYREAIIDIHMPDGRAWKKLVYEEDMDYTSRIISASTTENGVWYSFTGKTHSRTRYIDRNGKETVYTPGATLAVYANDKCVVYHPTSAQSEYIAPISEYKAYFMGTDKTYKFSDLDVITIGADVDYNLNLFRDINGTRAIAGYRFSMSSDPNAGGKYKFAVIDFSNGKLLTPVYDDMIYSSSTNIYTAFTNDYLGKTTSAWYYNSKGKKLAKFDDGSDFTKDGYALVSNGKNLFFVNKKFERVSSSLKFNSSKGWYSVIGEKGIMTYLSGETGYFVVYA